MFLMNGRKGNACSLLIPYVFSDKINHGALGYIKYIAEHSDINAFEMKCLITRHAVNVTMPAHAAESTAVLCI